MIIISPAKNLNISPEKFSIKLSKPQFNKETDKLVELLKRMSSKNLKKLMNISESLANLNFERFAKFNSKDSVFKPAAFLFSGDTFNGLSIRSLQLETLKIAQSKLRILSGLYGLLRPLDLIQPYRLEMGTKITNELGTSLYDYWKVHVTSSINKSLKKNNAKSLFNLSSLEYFESVDKNLVNAEVVNFEFKKIKGDKLVNIGMMIKKYRGKMARFIISNNISNVNDLKQFKEDNFKFDSFNKENNSLLFITR